MSLFDYGYNYAQKIVIFAGVGSGTSDGDGGPATAAHTPLPVYGSFDKAGNYYFGEDGTKTIREVSTAGIIYTIAGNGMSGYSGDGGLATNAKIGYVAAPVVDSKGNLYIADYGNARIRKVDAVTGIINTIAGNGMHKHTGDGGPATASTLNPTDLCMDKFDNLYILDSARVRKIDVAGIINTIAGDGIGGYSGDGGPATSAGIVASVGICIDTNGNIYFSDGGGVRIRKVNITTGIISTIAGTGGYLYNGDEIPATSAQFKAIGLACNKTNDIYVCDYGNQRIRVIDVGGIIHTIAGDGTVGDFGDGGPASAAKFHGPYGIALDMCGNIYIADEQNNRIRKVIMPACDPSLKVVTIEESIRVEIYPNPINNVLHIDNVKHICNYKLLSITETVMWKGSLKKGSNTVNMATLASGVYLLQIEDEETKERVTKRAVKQ